MTLALVAFATRLDPGVFAHLVNAALFALVIFLSARLIHSGPGYSVAYSLLGMCAVLFSRAFSEVYAMAWSECLFIPLVLLYLVFAQHYWESGSMQSLVIMAFSTALVCMTRYIGVALVPAGIVTIMMASGVNFKNRFVRAFAFAALSLAPLGLWAARNHRLTGTLFGPRAPSEFSLWRSVILSAKTVLLWYVPGHGTKFIVLAVTALTLVAVISSRAVRRRASSSLRAILIGRSPTLFFLATYTLVLLVTSSTTAYDPINDRLLSPVYVVVTLVLLKLVSDLLSPTQLPSAALVPRAPAVLLALWLCFPLASTVRWSIVLCYKDGAGGYNTRRWRESKTIARAKQLLSASNRVHVYSNRYDALWELARVDATRSPDRAGVNLRDLEGRWPSENGSLLVYFKNDTWRTYLYSVEELSQVSVMEEVADFSDGSIYKVSVRQTVAQP
jgi:hypothetical protein